MTAPIYLFTGPEFWDRNDAVENIKSALKKKYSSVDEYLFYLIETPLSQAMTTLMDGSLFSEATCVVIKGAELIKKKDEIQIIESWLESNPSDSTTLILVSDEVAVDSKLEKLISTSNRKKFWEMFEDQKLPWVKNYFSKNGFSIEEEACELILEMIENNKEALKNECSRFFILFQKDHVITAEDVDSIISHNREENAFTLFNRLTDTSDTPQGRLESGLSILQKMRLSKDNSSVLIIAGLSSCFRKLQTWHNMISENPYPDDMTFKVNGFGSKLQQKQYRSASKLWTAGQTAAVLALLSSTDMQIRTSGQLLEDLLLQKMLYEIVIKKGGSSALWEEEDA